MSSSQFIALFVSGLAIGCIYSLIALGFTMIIRATGVLHFARAQQAKVFGADGAG